MTDSTLLCCRTSQEPRSEPLETLHRPWSAERGSREMSCNCAASVLTHNLMIAAAVVLVKLHLCASLCSAGRRPSRPKDSTTFAALREGAVL